MLPEPKRRRERAAGRPWRRTQGSNPMNETLANDT